MSKIRLALLWRGNILTYNKLDPLYNNFLEIAAQYLFEFRELNLIIAVIKIFVGLALMISATMMAISWTHLANAQATKNFQDGGGPNFRIKKWTVVTALVMKNRFLCSVDILAP